MISEMLETGDSTNHPRDGASNERRCVDRSLLAENQTRGVVAGQVAPWRGGKRSGGAQLVRSVPTSSLLAAAPSLPINRALQFCGEEVMGGLVSSRKSEGSGHPAPEMSKSEGSGHPAPEVALTKAKEVVSNTPVVVFSKTYCPYCVRVKQLLTQLGANYKAIELDVESDGSKIQSALAQWTGQRTVPNVFIGGNHIGGCDTVTDTHKGGKLVPLLTQAGALTGSAA